jgi:hypothetical protein
MKKKQKLRSIRKTSAQEDIARPEEQEGTTNKQLGRRDYYDFSDKRRQLLLPRRDQMKW